MRVPDDVLKCVGFIGEVVHQDSSGVSGDLCATGFFVAIPCQSPELQEMRFCYFITAKHVATDLEGRQAYFLVNAKAGGVVGVTGVIGEHWFLHPTDRTADVAAIQILMDPEADIQAIALQHFGLPERLERLHIGIGDETIISGLFTAVPGTTRNIPIVRHGNIAMMPGEQIQTELGFAEVFLVEARSIGGLSGSPVFVRHTLSVQVQRQRDNEDDHFFGNGPGITLLGLMHGHWDIKESEMNKPSIIHDRQHGVNMGIGIVVPAIKIYETLYAPRLVAMRKEQEIEILKRSIPGTDSVKSGRATQQAFTQAEFEAALKKTSSNSREEANVAGAVRNQSDMPDVPDVDFVGALCEIWFALNSAAYHLAYVRVYLQTAALQTDAEQLRKEEQALRNMTQADVVICRAQLAAFFWQLDHVFEALRSAVKRGQKEHPELKYFWSYERRLEEIEKMAERRQISAYRNKAHALPGIIGCNWEKKGGKFLHHFLPSIVGHPPNESNEMNAQLQQYFEFVGNVWLSFAPSDLKSKFPRNFQFTVTVPHSYIGELPRELENAPQLSVSIEAYDRADDASAKTGQG